ncbi:16S rRNA (cytidine(1402)-2'-O)-methyltransferase [Candidatus Margulisiibacteriota bacterium]
MIYFIGFNIGNAQDVTDRAKEVIRSCDVIYCEDTRMKLPFEGKRISFFEHNEEKRIDEVLQLEKEGKTIGIVTESGMPVISDPGYLLVRKLIEKNISFKVIPGVSAVTTALLYSGLPPMPFTFVGFLPRKKSDIEKLINNLSSTVVFFESAQRIEGTLKILKEMIPTKNIALCREMTKKYEEIVRGTVSEVLEKLPSITLKGELTVVLYIDTEKHFITIEQSQVVQLAKDLQLKGLSKKDIMSVLQKLGIRKNLLYEVLHE